ncbi:MAG TPA: hypothetical protein VJH37_02745 [Candidatus Nanoarchaeia archaeon]|nr:hypothetical protein [Candidatus Nanoarchaeia archaeon]
MIPFSFILSLFIAFFVSLWSIPWIIRVLRRINLVDKDIHKKPVPLLPRSGGLPVATGFTAGMMFFLFFFTFFGRDQTWLTESSLTLLFAAVLTIFVITFVGFLDDLLVVKSEQFKLPGGLRQWQKPLLTLVAAIPLMVVNAGTSKLIVPFIGHVDFGLLYPIVLVPLGVVGAANMVNLFAGLNGLESGLGLIYLMSLGSYAYVHERHLAAIIALVTFAALLAFYLYNKYPAKFLPGDSLTYLLGAVLATIAIVGDLEKATLIVAIPFFIEGILKIRGKWKKQTIGYIKNGKLHSQYEKIYSIPHIFMRTGKFTEKQIVYFMYIIQAIFASMIWFM